MERIKIDTNIEGFLEHQKGTGIVEVELLQRLNDNILVKFDDGCEQTIENKYEVTFDQTRDDKDDSLSTIAIAEAASLAIDSSDLTSDVSATHLDSSSDSSSDFSGGGGDSGGAGSSGDF